MRMGKLPSDLSKTRNPRTTQTFHTPQQAQHKLVWQHTLLFPGTGDVGIKLKPHELGADHTEMLKGKKKRFWEKKVFAVLFLKTALNKTLKIY